MLRFLAQRVHVAFVRRGYSKAWLYVNGQPVASVSTSCSFAYDGNIVTLGADLREPWIYFKTLSMMDHVFVFPYALSDRQIADVYQNPSSYTITPTVAPSQPSYLPTK